jgi:hypothetical protein
MRALLFPMLLILSPSLVLAEEAKKVAVAKIIRGDVEVMTMGKTLKLKVEDWVEQGAVIKTAEKSFAKLVFIDKSQMNVGPGSEMKIEKFEGNEAGVIDLVKGKVRSQVTKDYLQMGDNDKSKLFVKTPNAVMGIRGTDFMISTNGQTTSAVLFEGEVVFNKLSTTSELSTERLEKIVDSGVSIKPGEFSVVEPSLSKPTEPAILNTQQLEKLEKNETFDTDRTPSSNDNEQANKSVVPDGLDGVVVSNNPEALKNEVALISAVEDAAPKTTDGDAAGYVSGDKVKPANGSYVHLESGVIIPPGPGSVLDPNTNSYIPAPDQGQISATGEYVPPKNVEITSDGKILVAVLDSSGQVSIQEIEKPKPVATSTGVSLGNVVETLQNNPTLISATQPVSNDILNSSFVPGGLNDLTNLQRNTEGGITSINDAAQQRTDTQVTVRPTNGDK